MSDYDFNSEFRRRAEADPEFAGRALEYLSSDQGQRPIWETDPEWFQGVSDAAARQLFREDAR